MAKPRIPREFLGAFKAGHRPSARPFIDDEFAYILLKKVLRHNCQESRQALEYLTKFNNEYHKGVVKKGDPNAFHGEREARHECYNRRYRQMMDVFTRSPISLNEVSGF